MIPSHHFCSILIAGMAPACQEEEVRFSRAFFTNPGSASRTERPPQEGLRRLIDTAEKELLFSMFRFDLDDIVSALVQAHRRGVAVRVLTDQDYKLEAPPSAYRRLAQAGIPIASDTSIFNTVMHHKFVVVDRRVLWTGDWNAHRDDTFEGHHSAIQIRSPELAEIYRRLFTRLESGRNRDGLSSYPPLDLRRFRAEGGIEFVLHYTPETRGSKVVAAALAQAQKDVFVAHCYLDDRWVVKELLHAARRGVRVRGVYNATSHGYDRTFALQGVDMRKAAPIFVGSKYFVIDGKHLITGSWNCSHTHSDYDNIIEIRGDQKLCDLFAVNFEELFATATPFFNVTQESKLVDRASRSNLPPALDAAVIYREEGAPASIRKFLLDPKAASIGEKYEVLLDVDAQDLDPDSDWSIDLWVARILNKDGEQFERWNRPLRIRAESGSLYRFVYVWPGKGDWRLYARIVRVARDSGRRRIVGMYSAPFVQAIR